MLYIFLTSTIDLYQVISAPPVPSSNFVENVMGSPNSVVTSPVAVKSAEGGIGVGNNDVSVY